MSIQYFINRAQSIEIDRRKQVAVTMSRNMIARTAVRSEVQPWRFNVEFSTSGYRWEELRAPWETISDIDRITPEIVSLSDAPGMSYIMEYRGDYPTYLSRLTVNSNPTPKSLLVVVSGLPISPNKYVFRKGDFIQPSEHNYTYTVTEDVVRGAGSTVEVPIHRPFLSQTGYNVAGKSLNVATSCTFRVIISELPTIRVVEYQRAELTGNLGLIEYITL